MEIRRHLKIFINEPRLCTFDITYRCNLKCSMCGAWPLADLSKQKELSANEICKIADNVTKHFSVNDFAILGGEPFVRNDLLTIIKHIKKNKSKITVVTNGTLIDNDLAFEIVEARLDMLRISIDGNEPIHDAIRGQGTYDKIINGIQLINNAKYMLNSKFPRILIQPCISKFNKSSIKDIAILSKNLKTELGFHYLGTPDNFSIYKTIFKEKQIGSQRTNFLFSEPKYSLTDKEKTSFENNFINIQRRVDNTIEILGFKRGMARIGVRGLKRIFTKIWKYVPWYRDCFRAKFNLLIDPWGNVFPCEHLYNYSYGNCRVTNINEIWYSKERFDLRKEIKNGGFQICRKCNDLNIYREPLPILDFVAYNIKKQVRNNNLCHINFRK
jgi:radical SAM protein with 4Fe4S-binding SPASM domain